MSKFNNFYQRKPHIRQRGALLLEAILGLAILSGVIATVAVMMDQQNKRQENALVSASLRDLVVSSRAYVGENYDDILIDLYAEAAGSGDAILAVPMSTLASDGYLPSVILSGSTVKNIFGHDHHLLIRAVNRSDTNVPQATMALADIDPTSSGGIDATLVDGDPANGEMEIEAILTSSGGTAISGTRGGPIVSGTQIPTIGLVLIANEASGAFGNFTLDISPYSAFSAEYPTPGHFASIVALSGFGVLGGGSGGEADITSALLRCADIDSVTEVAAYTNCIENSDNELFSNIIMREWTDAAGTVNSPGILGLSHIACDPGASPVALTADELLIDCTSTNLSGGLDVATDISVGTTGSVTTITGTDINIGDVNLTTSGLNINGSNAIGEVPAPLSGSEIRLDVDRAIVNGEDLNEYLYDTEIVLAQTDITKMTCPINEAGVQMVPEIYVTPAAYADARGREIAGVRAFVNDSATSWRARMISFVSDDYCRSVDGGGNIIPLDPEGAFFANGAPDQPNCSQFDAGGGLIGTSQSDGFVDAYEISGNFGAVKIQQRCVTP